MLDHSLLHSAVQWPTRCWVPSGPMYRASREHSPWRDCAFLCGAEIIRLTKFFWSICREASWLFSCRGVCEDSCSLGQNQALSFGCSSAALDLVSSCVCRAAAKTGMSSAVRRYQGYAHLARCFSGVEIAWIHYCKLRTQTQTFIYSLVEC